MSLSRLSASALFSCAGVTGLVLAGGCTVSAPAPGGSTTSDPPAAPTSTGTSTPAADDAPVPQSHIEWRRAMARKPKPHAGCFHARHPSTTWEEVPCGKAPDVRLAPPRPGAGGPAMQVGNGYGDNVSTVAGTISYAEGSFPQSSGFKQLAGVGPGQPLTASYSLQLNTNPQKGASYCGTGPNAAGCSAWQQFVYLGDQLFMQYWLINYWATDPGTQQCPGGFGYYDNGYYSGTTVEHQYDCYATAFDSANVPAFSGSDLPYLSLAADVSDGDSMALYYFGEIMALMPTTPSYMNVKQWWKSAEFNVFGPGYGSAAVFNYGTTMSVQTITDSLIPTTVAPSCKSTSFTGEINNLNAIPGSCCATGGGGTTGIFFTQSNAPGAAAYPCP